MTISAVTFRQFIANLLRNMQRMPALAQLYRELSDVIARYDDCKRTCEIPFTKRQSTSGPSAAAFDAAFGRRLLMRLLRPAVAAADAPTPDKDADEDERDDVVLTSDMKENVRPTLLDFVWTTRHGERRPSLVSIHSKGKHDTY